MPSRRAQRHTSTEETFKAFIAAHFLGLRRAGTADREEQLRIHIRRGKMRALPSR